VAAEKGRSCAAAAQGGDLASLIRENQLIRDVVTYSREMHEGQVRKFSKGPYISHPLRVAGIVMRFTTDPVAIATAILHDTIENTKATHRSIRKRFGIEIADSVKALSSDKRRIARMGGKHKYLAVKMLRMELRELLVKLADRLDNTSDFEMADLDFVTNYRDETHHILAIVSQRMDLEVAHKVLVEEIYEAMLTGERALRDAH